MQFHKLYIFFLKFFKFELDFTMSGCFEINAFKFDIISSFSEFLINKSKDFQKLKENCCIFFIR